MKAYLIIAVVAVAAIAVPLIAGAFGPEQIQASTPVTDTVVNVERWVNPNGDRLAAVRPDRSAQPVYYIWLTQECAATLQLGDAWPSHNPACEVSH